MMGNKLSMRVGIWVVVALTLALGWPGLVLGGVPYLWIFGPRLPSSGRAPAVVGEAVKPTYGLKDDENSWYRPGDEQVHVDWWLRPGAPLPNSFNMPDTDDDSAW